MFRLDRFAPTWIARLILAGVALASGLVPREAKAADRYVVVASPPFQVRQAEQDQLLKAIQSGLRAAGCEAILAPLPSEECTSAACWKRLAATTEATEVLVVTGGYKDLGWSLSFEHRSGTTGVKVGSEKENCDACPFDAMVDKARSTARHVAESERSEADASVGGPTPSSVGASPVRLEANPLTNPPAASAEESRPVWPILLMAGGGAGLAGGIMLMAINGRDTDCSQDTCLRRYKTMTPGLVLGAGGLAAAAVGIWQYVAWQPASTAISLRLGPGHISFAGGF